jgi:RNA polymerase sigma-70 factor (ECF subfamily)
VISHNAPDSESGLRDGLAGGFDYNCSVFALNPTFMTLETPETGGLLDRARAGDSEAFCELCRVYETGLLRQATALCGNATLAEDLAQDTLVEAWKDLRRYNGRCRFFTWLCAILLHRHRNTLRRKRPLSLAAFASQDGDGFEDRTDQLADDAARPDQAALMHEEAALVRDCVQSLPLKQRQVIHLRFYVDDSLAGIAAALGCSVGTVKSRLFYALEKLRGMRDLGRNDAVEPLIDANER